MFYRGELFGVIELQNKIQTPIFTKLDEEYAVPFGIVCGYFLGKCLTLRRLENTRAAQFNGDTLLLRNLMVINFMTFRIHNFLFHHCIVSFL